MFEFSRELRRRLGASGLGFRDGLTGGDASLFELIDLAVLAEEAKAAEVGARRAGVRDPASALLISARTWRELARRTGDPVALRKAAANAASAHSGFVSAKRRAHLAMARLEQARCAMLGAELFGDEGLTAAAETALRQALAAGGAGGALAGAELAGLEAKRALNAGDATTALAKTRAAQAPVLALKAAGKSEPGLKLMAVDYALAGAERMALCGMRLKDMGILSEAGRAIGALIADLDEAYEPLMLARAKAHHGQVLAMLGETSGDVAILMDGARLLSEAVDAIGLEQSPMDHVVAQTALGLALRSLGEATGARALEGALTAFDRALKVLKAAPLTALRATIANHRAVCLGRLAEVTGDLAILDAAEAALKDELAALSAPLDPLAWAVGQVNLARLYETRTVVTGRDNGERARAALALTMALEVFSENGQCSLALIAQDGLERLKQKAS